MKRLNDTAITYQSKTNQQSRATSDFLQIKYKVCLMRRKTGKLKRINFIDTKQQLSIVTI